MDKWLKVGEVARMFGVDPKTVGQWCRDGKIPGVIFTPGGQRRIPRDEVEKILAREQT